MCAKPTTTESRGRSTSNTSCSGPEWINRFLTVAAVLACVAALLAVIRAPRNEYGRYADTVADIVVNLNGTPVREHCTTCHPAGAPAAALGGAEDRAHPEVGVHSLDDLGCTGCHLGEGMALEPEVSHGRVGNRSRGLLTGEDLQATCYRCHVLAPLPGAEGAWNGYQLFRDLACGSCHRLAEGEHRGRYGPDLSNVGTYLGLEQLSTAVADPRREPETSTMPRFPLSRAEVLDLAHFLKSRVANPAHSTPMQRRTQERGHRASSKLGAEEPTFTGAELFRSLGCRACHRRGDEGGWIGPDLTYIGNLRDGDYLRRFLLAPTRVIPGARMPRIAMGDLARKTVVEFLSLTVAGVSDEASPKRVYMALCQPCHAADGTGAGVIQPNLVQFPRAFRGNAEFFRRAENQRLVQSIKGGVPGTSMPPYGRLLTGTQLDTTLDLIFRSFVGVSRSDKNLLPPLPMRPEGPAPEPQVGRTYARNCSGCHGRAGNGKGPEYARHLPRPRNLTNRAYFEALSDERIARAVFDGVSGTAMGGFRRTLSPELGWGLVQRVRSFSEGTDE